MFFGKKKKTDLDEMMSTDYKNRCGNCTEYLEKEDRYCRYCGTKRGEGAFEPYHTTAFCIYGPPPVKRKHVCKHCGNRWIAEMMIDNQKYCGRCGMPAEIEKEFSFYILSRQDTNRMHNISAFDGNVRVGRDEALEINWQDDEVSRLHAQFVSDEEKLYLMDMNSKNGTYVNRQRIGTKPYLLHDGDEITFGNVRCTLEKRM